MKNKLSLYLSLLFMGFASQMWGQTNSEAHDLSSSDYAFSGFTTSMSKTIDPVIKKYELITGTEELTPGNYLISNDEFSVALGWQDVDNHNRKKADVTINSGSPDYILVNPSSEDTNHDLPYAIEILAGSDNSHYYLKDNVNNKYLVSSTWTNDSNQLKGQDDPSDWTITFDIGGNAVITNTEHNVNGRNIMRYNSVSGLFSCYAEGQKDIYLYKEAAEISVDYIYSNNSWWPNHPGDSSNPSTDESFIYIENGKSGQDPEEIIAVLGGNIEAKTLYVNNGAEVDVTGILSITGNIQNEGLITFKSSSAGTGQLDTFTGEIIGSGSVTTESYFPANRAFRFVTSAVDSFEPIHENWQEGAEDAEDDPNPGYGIHITGDVNGAKGFDATPSGAPSMFEFDNATQNWGNIDNTNSTLLEAGTPYRLFVRGSRAIDLSSNASEADNTTLRATGALKTGEVIFNNMSATEGKFNFAGNPYQAIVDIESVIVNNSTNINDAYFYVWNPTVGDEGAGAYVVVYFEGEVGNSVEGSDADQYVKPGQAFFVRTLNDGAAELKFSESDKAVNPGEGGKPVAEDFASVRITLYESTAFQNDEKASDGVLVLFSEDGDNSITYKDAPKMTNINENLATLTSGKYLSIESRAFPVDNEKIKLFTNQYQFEDYVFVMRATDLPEDITAYLWDKFTDTYTEITEETVYEYSIVNGGDLPNRFEVVFEEEGQMNISELTTASVTIYPNPIDGNRFTISSKELAGKEVQLQIHNMAGQQIVNAKLKISANGKIQTELPMSSVVGTYSVTILENGKRIFNGKIIKR